MPAVVQNLSQRLIDTLILPDIINNVIQQQYDQIGRRLRNVRVAERNRYDDVPTGKLFREQNNANMGGLSLL